MKSSFINALLSSVMLLVLASFFMGMRLGLEGSRLVVLSAGDVRWNWIFVGCAVVFLFQLLRTLFFWLIFITLMLPVEVRILPTVQVIADLNMLDSYSGLTLPLMASATATFLFRQFFMSLPDELIEAARIDGASALRFFWEIVLPLSKNNLAALFVITFIYGWNQYLWQLLIVNDASLSTAVAGIKSMSSTSGSPTQWNEVMAAMLLTLIPPVLVVLVMQRAFVLGLVESEK